MPPSKRKNRCRSILHFVCPFEYVPLNKEKGKPSIVIIGAVMTKLLHLIYGVLKSEKPFNPDILKKAQIIP
jgi:hypothetical protein